MNEEEIEKTVEMLQNKDKNKEKKKMSKKYVYFCILLGCRRVKEGRKLPKTM